MGPVVCPICFRSYQKLSQHLRVTHSVNNDQERKLLLTLQSGRVNVREGTCPVAGCGKSTSRMDRHLQGHTELSKSARQEAMLACKRKKVMKELADLRASNPTIPLASMLDIQDEPEDPPPIFEEQEESQCDNPACKQARKRLEHNVADLNLQVDSLSSTLQDVSRRYRLLQRRRIVSPASQVARVSRKLLSALQSTEEEEGSPTAGPSQVPPGEETEESAPPLPPSPKSEAHYPEHVPALNELIEEYRRHQEGADPSEKLKNNVASKIYRIKQFMGYMAVGKSNLASLIFLNETNRMRSWVNNLHQSKITEPTIHHYLKNVAQFLDYMAETPPPNCRLSKYVMVSLRREMRAMIKALRRKVVVHEVAVKAAKEERLIPKSVLQKCQSLAKEAIPKILESLKTQPESKDQWSFYGHLTAYLASIYGHRGGVFQNMLIKEVEGAKKSTSGDSYVINITTHKTNQAFGAAQIALKEEEYDWFRQFLALRSGLLGGTEAKVFFFTSKPSPCKNLNAYFQEAWKAMGLPGCPTFTDIRTAIATHAKNSHKPEERYKISQFMCHDTSTADKFYAVNLNPKQAVEHRLLFEQALEGPESSPVKGEAIPKPTKRKRPAATATKARKRPAKASSPSSSSASETSQEGTEEEAVTACDTADPQPSPRTSEDPPQTPKRLLLSTATKLRKMKAVVLLSPLKSPFELKKSPLKVRLAQRLVGRARKTLKSKALKTHFMS